MGLFVEISNDDAVWSRINHKYLESRHCKDEAIGLITYGCVLPGSRG